jgi:hypothetical protein
MKSPSTPLYKIIRWPRGWTVEPGSEQERGIPMDVASEALAIAGKNKSDIHDPGIVHHLQLCYERNTVFAFGHPQELDLWRAEIEDHLKIRFSSPEERWLRGTDTGISSLSIFCALTSQENLRRIARSMTDGRTPIDEHDLNRCLRLLEKNPGWESRLAEVPTFWDTQKTPQRNLWKVLVPRWDELKAASPTDQRKILREAVESPRA